MEKNHYSEIGKLLRQAREEHRLTKERVSQLMHMRIRYIEALEEGNLSAMPGLSYTKGYLQNYAAFLGLDKDEILRRFEQVEESLGRSTLSLPQVFSEEKTPTPRIIWGALAGLLVVYILWTVALKPSNENVPIVDTFQKKPIVLSQPHDPACFEFQIPYYPSCFRAINHHLSILPVQGRMYNSLMEIPNFDWVITDEMRDFVPESTEESDE